MGVCKPERGLLVGYPWWRCVFAELDCGGPAMARGSVAIFDCSAAQPVTCVPRARWVLFRRLYSLPGFRVAVHGHGTALLVENVVYSGADLTGLPQISCAAVVRPTLPSGRATSIEGLGRVCLELSGRLLFDSDGNRRKHTGEHIVSLQPRVVGGQTLAESYVTVWYVPTGHGTTGWRRFGRPLHLFYNDIAERTRIDVGG